MVYYGVMEKINLAISEKRFQDAVVQLAQILHFRVYHTYDSRRSTPGYPDLTLVREGRLIFAELKSEKGKMSKAQKEWEYDLRQTCAEYYEWRPSDWEAIVEVLQNAPIPPKEMQRML